MGGLDGDAHDSNRHSASGSLRLRPLLARLRLPDERALGAPVRRIIFACPDNAGRAVMAAAFFNHLADPRLARAISASTRPAGPIQPTVLQAMLEVGVDLPQAPPRTLTSPLVTAAHHLITMGCEEDCPFFPGVKVEEWPIEDPQEVPAARIREIRDDVHRRVEAMVRSNRWTRSEPAARDGRD